MSDNFLKIYKGVSHAGLASAPSNPVDGDLYYDTGLASFQFRQNGAWVSLSASPLTTKGDVYGFSTVNARIPIGTNNQVLTADSTQALGLKWATPASSSTSPFTVTPVSSNITMANLNIYLVDTSVSRTLTFPAPSANAIITVLDSTGNCNANNITLLQSSTEKIQNLAASLVMQADFISLTFASEGTNWYISAR